MAQFTAGSNHGPINIDLFGSGKWRVAAFPLSNKGPWSGQFVTNSEAKSGAGMIPFVRFYGKGKQSFYLKTYTHVMGLEPVSLGIKGFEQFPENGLNEYLFESTPIRKKPHVIDWTLEHKFNFRHFIPVCFGFYWVADSFGADKI